MTVTTNGIAGTQSAESACNAIIGESPKLLAAKELALLVAPSDVPVLIVGDTGTGKELLANYIHAHSEREGPLVDVDCGALPDDLVEGLLFGHRKGAFTGAVAHSRGLIAEADGGTLFLDELGSLPLRGQAKLLRVLESGYVRRVGDPRPRRVSFRVIATVQRSLLERLAEGSVRGDLLQRVAGVVVELPSLAQRTGDVPILVRGFAKRLGLEISADAVEHLATLPWPGNVRQLRWTVTRCSLFTHNGLIDAHAVRSALETGPRALSDTISTVRTEESASELAALCRRHHGDSESIAAALGVGRATLYRRLRQHGMSLRAFRNREVD